MKSVKCSKCGKTVEVSDSWTYTRCEICRTKDVAYKQVLKRSNVSGTNKWKCAKR